MTTFTDAFASPPIAPFRIHYVDPPTDFTSVRVPEEPGRPVAAALATVALVLAVAIVAAVVAVLVS
jgi:hypothetical protein